jgi:hypothetical protein
MASALMERYDDRIAGVLSCYDRVVVTGTLPIVCFAGGMTRFLYANRIRIFDYPTLAATLRDHVRKRAAAVAAEAGISVEHVGKSHVRKEAIVAKVLHQRGRHPGLVHVISAMEACDAYKPWHDLLALLASRSCFPGSSNPSDRYCISGLVQSPKELEATRTGISLHRQPDPP